MWTSGTTRMEDLNKFRELMLYVCAKCAGHQKFGAVKLNKILFYSDFLAYVRLGVPITSVEYQKLEHGPAPRKLLPIQTQLVEQGDLQIQERVLLSGRRQRRPVNLRRPQLSVFSPDEIALVDEVIEILGGLTADDVSELSHREIGWKAAEYGETIPYETALISTHGPTQQDRTRGESVKQDYADLLGRLA